VESQYFSRYPRDVIYSDGSYTIIRDTAGTYLGYSTPIGVNNDGEIVGNYAKYPNSIGGFVYNGAYSFIPGFPGNSYAGVNDLGQVTGSSGTIYSAGAGRGGRLLMGIGACRSAFAQAYLLADLGNFFLRHHNTGQVVGTYLTAPIGREIVRPEFACLHPKLTM
jgi:hypothetical protein